MYTFAYGVKIMRNIYSMVVLLILRLMELPIVSLKQAVISSSLLNRSIGIENFNFLLVLALLVTDFKQYLSSFLHEIC